MSGTITWLGQAGFLVKTETGSFAVDPFLGTAKGNSERMYPPFLEKGEVHVDMVLTTHDHWDHFDPETYQDYVIPEVIVGPSSVMRALERCGLPIQGIELNRNRTLERCGFTIKAVFADHTNDSVGFLVEAEGKKLFFSGDTELTARLCTSNAGLCPDVACICINGKLGNMNYFEAASYCKLLGAKTGVPTHYDLIRHNSENPKEFTDAMARIAPDIKALVMERNVEYPLADF